MKLLIIADDFTGALDTGVQFASKGIRVQVMIPPVIPFSQLSEDVQVLVIDAETRHLPPEQAYCEVYTLVQEACNAGFTHFYKKTDSALRGNVGSELAAMMDAANAENLAFLPALPKMNRITQNGIHYIDGVPVADSVFGQDPFEPVTQSVVKEILVRNWQVKTLCHKIGETEYCQESGIHVYDAQSQDELIQWGQMLGEENLRFCAGCAGFGAVIADMMFPQAGPIPVPKVENGLFVVCGSVNAVTLRQMDEAEKAGFHHIHLTPVQKLESSWQKKTETIAKWLELAASGRCILDVNDPADCEDTAIYATTHNLTTEEMRQSIAKNLAALVKAMMDSGLNSTILCTGGDTLLALMKQLNVSQLLPVGECAPGVVLANLTYKEKFFRILSKSGGFGTPDLFIKLVQ